MTRDEFVRYVDGCTDIVKVNVINSNEFCILLKSRSIPNGTLRSLANIMCQVEYSSMLFNAKDDEVKIFAKL